MKSKFIIALILSILWIESRSQGKLEKLKAAKVAYLSTRMNLNTTEAQQFWPLYNEYEDKKQKIKKELRKLRIDNDIVTGTDAENLADLRKMMQIRQDQLDIDKEYMEKFLKVFSPKKMVEFYTYEKEFTRLLLKRLKEGKKGDLEGIEKENE